MIAENFPNLRRDIDIQLQKLDGLQVRSTQRIIMRQVKIKMLNVKGKEKIMKAAKEKQLNTCNRIPIRLLVVPLKKTSKNWHF